MCFTVSFAITCKKLSFQHHALWVTITLFRFVISLLSVQLKRVLQSVYVYFCVICDRVKKTADSQLPISSSNRTELLRVYATQNRREPNTAKGCSGLKSVFFLLFLLDSTGDHRVYTDWLREIGNLVSGSGNERTDVCELRATHRIWATGDGDPRRRWWRLLLLLFVVATNDSLIFASRRASLRHGVFSWFRPGVFTADFSSPTCKKNL